MQVKNASYVVSKIQKSEWDRFDNKCYSWFFFIYLLYIELFVCAFFRREPNDDTESTNQHGTPQNQTEMSTVWNQRKHSMVILKLLWKPFMCNQKKK